MFSLNREQVRRFVIEAWRKRRANLPAEPLEVLMGDIVALHPEYQALLENDDAALQREWTPEGGQTNPFLHLSLHLAIEEQLSIDQPFGIRAIAERLSARLGDRHEAVHRLIECLAETIWLAQRNGRGFDQQGYLECLRRQ